LIVTKKSALEGTTCKMKMGGKKKLETKILALAVVMVVTISAAFAPAMAGEAKGSFMIGGNPTPVVGSIEL